VNQRDQQHVIIVGGGLAGALMACYLARAGYRVDVYEKRPDPRVRGFIGGRSINLALSVRGITALQEVGLAERILKDAVRMPGRMIHDPAGHTTFQPYSKDPSDAINSVSRGGLNLTLLDAADAHDNVTLHFGLGCRDVDLDRPSITLVNEEAGDVTEASADFIIGADGAFSTVRRAMLERVMNFDYSQSFLEHGYKELSIPPDGGGFRMEPNALHIWPRGGSMMIALPNQDRSFTCTLFWPYRGAHSFAAIRTEADVVPFFEKHYPDAVPLMPTLVHDYQSNPVSSLVTVRCAPWHYSDKVVLIGDAAHAIVPFFGQGMNAAFEDCRMLNRLLLGNRTDRSRAFGEFSRERKDNADAIADMALENFIEMRDKTASVLFRVKKKLEQRLHASLPGVFTPLYNMVSFTNIPYAEARTKAQRQGRILKRIGWAFVIALVAIVLVVVTAWMTRM